ncbi:MAG: hypothetical protein IJ774_05985 [Selenomonadaceae bacterium]|nr:hypothetical protein [Selenomonadaceae bacterium]
MSKTKTFEEWVALYEKKTGVKFQRQPICQLAFFPDRGFAEFAAAKGILVIHQLCGDAKFWKQVGEVLAMEHNLKACGTWCIRDIEPYIKFFNAEIERVEELPDGLKRYHCRFKDTGKAATCSPRFKSENGKIGYMVTWEI